MNWRNDIFTARFAVELFAFGLLMLVLVLGLGLVVLLTGP